VVFRSVSDKFCRAVREEFFRCRLKTVHNVWNFVTYPTATSSNALTISLCLFENYNRLRCAVCSPITLVVAKCWDPNPKGYLTIPRQEPVRPIDPSAWVNHTEAMRNMDMWGRTGPPSVSTVTSTSSSLISSIPANECTLFSHSCFVFIQWKYTFLATVEIYLIHGACVGFLLEQTSMFYELHAVADT